MTTVAHHGYAHQGRYVHNWQIATGGCSMTEREHDRLTLRKAIGAILQHLRNRDELSLRELADEANYSYTCIHRAETGEQLASEPLIEALDMQFSMGGTLVDLVQAARAGLIQEYGRTAAAREAKAERIQVCTSSVIPSLLQTEDYARAMLRTQHPKAPRHSLDGFVADRMKRQQVFSREEPPQYWAIVDEAALRRLVSSNEVMTDQLAHVLKVAEHPDFTIQVVPFTHGEYWMLGGSLTLLTGSNGTTLAYVESFGSGELVESTKQVVRLTRQFDVVRGLALPEPDSLDVVRNYLEAYRGQGSRSGPGQVA